MAASLREKAASLYALACSISVLMVVAGCAQTKEAPGYSPRNVTLEIVAADAERSSYSLVMHVEDDQGALIDQARVDGLRLTDRKAIDIVPHRCRTYNASVENGAYMPKTFCSGITIKGSVWPSHGVPTFSIEHVAYTELVRMRTFQPNPSFTVEQAVVDRAEANGGIVFYSPDGSEYSKLRLRTPGVH